jgi:Fe-S cluster assembly ATP-binding protein
VLLITHYQRILNYIAPDRVHVMMQGRIVKSGGPELAHELEEKGYEGIREELGLAEGAEAEGDEEEA